LQRFSDPKRRRRDDCAEHQPQVFEDYQPVARPTKKRGRDFTLRNAPPCAGGSGLFVTRYGDCSFCGGQVIEEQIDYDYRREKRLMVVSNVPAGVCRQYGKKYFKPDVLKPMDSLYHGIFERNEKPHGTLSIAGVSL
jgi:YgiT-type zinc finger domain-containing protein